jgi:hypothetical protein
MNRALNDTLDDAAFEARLRANVERMRWLRAEMLREARRDHPGSTTTGSTRCSRRMRTTAAMRRVPRRRVVCAHGRPTRLPRHARALAHEPFVLLLQLVIILASRARAAAAASTSASRR